MGKMDLAQGALVDHAWEMRLQVSTEDRWNVPSFLSACSESGFGVPKGWVKYIDLIRRKYDAARIVRIAQLESRMTALGLAIPQLHREIDAFRSQQPLHPDVFSNGNMDHMHLWAEYCYYEVSVEAREKQFARAAAKTLDKMLGWREGQIQDSVEPLHYTMACPTCNEDAAVVAVRRRLTNDDRFRLTCSHCGHVESQPRGTSYFLNDDLAACVCASCVKRRKHIVDKVQRVLPLLRHRTSIDLEVDTQKYIDQKTEDAARKSTSFYGRESSDAEFSKVLKRAHECTSLRELCDHGWGSAEQRAFGLVSAGKASALPISFGTGDILKEHQRAAHDRAFQEAVRTETFEPLRSYQAALDALNSGDFKRMSHALESIAAAKDGWPTEIPSSRGVRFEAVGDLRRALGQDLFATQLGTCDAGVDEVEQWVKGNAAGTIDPEWIRESFVESMIGPRRIGPTIPDDMIGVELHAAPVLRVGPPKFSKVRTRGYEACWRLGFFLGPARAANDMELPIREVPVNKVTLASCSASEKNRAWAIAQALGLADLAQEEIQVTDHNWERTYAAVSALGTPYLAVKEIVPLGDVGEHWTPVPTWENADEDAQRLSLGPLLEDIRILDDVDYMVFNVRTGQMLQLGGEWTASMLLHISRTPTVNPVQAVEMAYFLKDLEVGRFLPAPRVPRVQFEEVGLSGAIVRFSGEKARYGAYEPRAEVQYSTSTGGTLEPYVHDGIVIIPRSAGTGPEALKVRAEGVLGQIDDESTGFGEAQRWLSVRDELAALRSEGIELVVDKSFPYKLLSEHTAEFVASCGPNRSVEVGIEIGGNITPIREVLRAASDDVALRRRLELPVEDDEELWFLELGDAHVRIVLKRLVTIVHHLQDLTTDNKEWRAPAIAKALQIAYMQESLRLRYLGNADMAALLRALGKPTQAVLAKLPPPLQERLWSVQREGIAWMHARACANLGGVVADQMGLGKTLQAIAFLYLRHLDASSDSASLVILPKAVDEEWRREMATHNIYLPNVSISGRSTRTAFQKVLRNSRVVFMTYTTARLNSQLIREATWMHVLADEGHELRNSRSDVFAAVSGIKAASIFPLTGTPWNNSTMDLWPLYELSVPGLLGDEKSFRLNMRNPMDMDGSKPHFDRLKRRIRPFTLRRTRAQANLPMPPSTTRVVSVPMAQAQRDLYESIRASVSEEVCELIERSGFARAKARVLNALIRLRQVTSHPRLLKGMSSAALVPSAKYDALLVELEDQEARGNQAVVCSPFSSLLELAAQDRLRDGRHVASITGASSLKARKEAKEALNEDDLPVLLLSMKAGGTALNLQAANTFILYDRWWNPHAEEQARFRVDRPGQQREMEFIVMSVQGSIDERMAAISRRKLAISEAIFGDAEALASELSERDVFDLIAPLDPTPILPDLTPD